MISEKTFKRLLAYEKIKVRKEYEFKTKIMKTVLAKDVEIGDFVMTIENKLLMVVEVAIFKSKNLVVLTYDNDKTWNFCLDDDIEIQ